MPIYFIFELIALIAAIFCIKTRYRFFRVFVPFLFLIVVYEYGSLQGWFTIKTQNLWAVNIITLIEFGFYGFFLSSILIVHSNKRRARICVITVLLISIINILFLQGFWKLHSYTLVLGGLFIIYLVCVFFYELLRMTSHTEFISRFPLIWISTGVLFFYLNQFLFFAFFEYMAYKNDYSYYQLFKIISNVSNVILYSCLSIAFIWSSSQIKRS